MKILHLASFVGNIGDNASHSGLEVILSDLISNYSIERLEIRKFYKNYKGEDKAYFDQVFINYLNSFDLCIIGGGGFLDYWVEGSSSGTTLDITPENISKIQTPTLICSVGSIPHKNVPEGNIPKFQQFLVAVQQNPKIKILLRNDGSFENINNNVGPDYTAEIGSVLDSAFFVSKPSDFNFPAPAPYIAINITSDQLLMHSLSRGRIDIESYYSQLQRVITYICNDLDLAVVFVPHIHSDLTAISKTLSYLDDFMIRSKISIAPCVQHDAGAEAIYSIYNNAICAIGMRYHANICPIALGVPSLGLAALDRVTHMYDSLGYKDRSQAITGDFSQELISKIERTLCHRDAIANSYSSTTDKLKRDTLDTYLKFFADMDIRLN